MLNFSCSIAENELWPVPVDLYPCEDENDLIVFARTILNGHCAGVDPGGLGCLKTPKALEGGRGRGGWRVEHPHAP